MKRLLTVLIALTLITSVFPSCFYAEDKTSYTEIFEKDKVIDVKIDIAAADLEDMRNYPQNEEYHVADITVDGVTVENAGIRTKGNMTLNSVAGSDSERYSYRIKFNKYVKGNKLLGLDELCLNNGYSDASYMREYLHYEILRSLGMNVPETAFCNVYINGEYAGFYLAVEGMDDTFLKDNFGENYKDGSFYKMDEGASLEYRQDENYSYADLKSGGDEDLTEFKKFVKALNDTETGEKGDIESFLDVDSALKYIASNTVLCNYDSYNGNRHHNYYLYKNSDGVFTVVPWDFNMSFGGFNGSNSEVGIDTPFISGSLETLPLINKLLSVDEYKEKYYGYIKQIMNTLESFEDRVSELKEIISPYVKNDTTAFYTYDEFDSATKAGTETADTSSGTNADKGRGRQFGSGLSVIDCIKDRLENLNKQFSGEASKTTEVSQNGKGGGRGDGMMQKHGGDSNGNNPPQMPGGNSNGNNPPQMPGGNSNGNEPPQMPGGDSNGNNPPQMPGGDNNGNEPPQMPGGDSNGNEPPQMPGGNSNGNEPPQMPGGNRKNQSQPFGGSENNSVIRVHVNGHILSFDCNPYIENDSTLVGFRSVTEALGASVEWDEKTKTVTAVRGDTVISLTADSNEAYVNGKRYELAAAPEITNDSLMIPVRFISEQLGMKVVWDADTKLITITSK